MAAPLRSPGARAAATVRGQGPGGRTAPAGRPVAPVVPRADRRPRAAARRRGRDEQPARRAPACSTSGPRSPPRSSATPGCAPLPRCPRPRLYTGVLYEALGLESLPPAARRTANRSLVVVSALWGALRPTDAVPPYRVSMGTSLPGIGPLAAYWRPLLDAPLTEAAGDGLVVDCRSSTYQAAWTPGPDLAARTVAVRVLREADGRRSVVSHMAKHTRGEVVRHLLLRGGRAPRTPARLAAAVGEAFEVEPGERRLDVVVRT
nr:peroxide stress protein YaaA [Angustibacter aerolatus]